MELDRQAIVIARMVASLYEMKFTERYTTEGVEKILNSFITNDKQRQDFINILKSMTLLTSGNVETVRQPMSFQNNLATPWSGIISAPVRFMFSLVNFNENENISYEDYKMANSILPVVASSSIAMEEIRNVFNQNNFKENNPDLFSHLTSKDSTVEGFEYLYRGLHDMSDSVVLLLSNIGFKWDMSRTVSTSVDKKVAEDFSLQGDQNIIVMSMKNPKGRGLSALHLSKFSGEREVPLSAVAEVTGYNMEILAKESGEGKSFIDDGVWFYINDDSIMIEKNGDIILDRPTMSQDEVTNFVSKLITTGLQDIELSNGEKLSVDRAEKSTTMNVELLIN